MTIMTPMEIRAKTDEITRAVKGVQSLDAIKTAKEQLAGISAYVKERRDDYQRAYGDEALRFVLKEIHDTGVFIGLHENEMIRDSQKDERKALGYRV